ncbi:hypothetical protein [Paenibacillus tundrae]|uniref:Lipoprotein n=1 Tax=Paenibacillus tundrae TaxID=528187 RepID=A0ABT9WK31_9BACL|nr:hypothetical protein [Paenibacillus tundrae]MDQ0173653.1 hypothetical protein [Paenibacillus tundrae]
MTLRLKGTLLTMLIVLLTIATGCDNSKEVNQAIQAGETYKNVEYTVTYQEDIFSEESILERNKLIKPFLTDEYYSKAELNRYTTLPFLIVQKQQLSLKPENLAFEPLNQPTENTYDLHYTLDFVLFDQDENEVKRVPSKGLLTMMKVDDKWLVQADEPDWKVSAELSQ